MERDISTPWAEMKPGDWYDNAKCDEMYRLHRENNFKSCVNIGNRKKRCKTCIHFKKIELSAWNGWIDTRCEIYGLSECSSFVVHEDSCCDLYQLTRNAENL